MGHVQVVEEQYVNTIINSCQFGAVLEIPYGVRRDDFEDDNTSKKVYDSDDNDDDDDDDDGENIVF